MLKPHPKPVVFGGLPDCWNEWERDRIVVEGDQVAWLAENIRDTDFFHLTALGDLWCPDEGIIEWILEQPECSVGTALYIYMSAMHFNPRDFAKQEWNMTSLHWPRHGAMKLQAAKGLREGRYKPIAYKVPPRDPGPRGENPNLTDRQLFDMIRALPSDHPMHVPSSALDVAWDRTPKNYYDWEICDACHKFVESYASYGLKKAAAMPKQPKQEKRETRQERRQRNKHTAEILGVMAVGLAASFLKGRR